MLPQTIADHKRKWMIDGGAYKVRVHSDVRTDCIIWCKQLDKSAWNHVRFTGVYEDTFYFEKVLDAQQFESEFKRWIQ